MIFGLASFPEPLARPHHVWSEPHHVWPSRANFGRNCIIWPPTSPHLVDAAVNSVEAAPYLSERTKLGRQIIMFPHFGRNHEQIQWSGSTVLVQCMTRTMLVNNVSYNYYTLIGEGLGCLGWRGPCLKFARHIPELGRLRSKSAERLQHSVEFVPNSVDIAANQVARPVWVESAPDLSEFGQKYGQARSDMVKLGTAMQVVGELFRTLTNFGPGLAGMARSRPSAGRFRQTWKGRLRPKHMGP